jgi:pyruvate/2-oxoacid:ferredoxin oxidoreductase alpha subunit
LKCDGKFIIFETSRTGQLGKLIKLHNSFTFEHVILKYNGRPFDPGEICSAVREVL